LGHLGRKGTKEGKKKKKKGVRKREEKLEEALCPLGGGINQKKHTYKTIRRGKETVQGKASSRVAAVGPNPREAAWERIKNGQKGRKEQGRIEGGDSTKKNS